MVNTNGNASPHPASGSHRREDQGLHPSIRSRILLFSVNQYDFPYPVFPLGAAQVEAALRTAGHTVHFVDYNVNPRPVRDLVSTTRPDYVGISLRNIDDALIQKRQTFFEGLLSLVRDIRRHSDATIVLGGSGFSIFPQELLQLSGADYGIQGEGEGPFLALIEALNRNDDRFDIPGLVYRHNGAVVVNARTRIASTAEVPLPGLPSDITAFYLRHSSMLNLQTQRGCALRCCYCTYPVLEGRNYRLRSPESVLEEMERMESAGARYVFIVDSVFNTSHAHVAGICEAMLKANLKLKWCCFLRPKRMTRELMRLMVRAGLSHAEFGSDSFSNPVLQAYGKNLTFDDILEASLHASEAGIDYAHFLILGGPGETEETLEETIANSRRLPHPTLMARVGMRVYPGTPLFDQLRADARGSTLPPLLNPFYHVAPPLTEQGVLNRLRQVAADMPNWIYDDPPPEYYRMAERLRARGVVGPLWSYFAILQRLGNLGGPTATRAPGLSEPTAPLRGRAPE